jgi:fructose-1,6-bisphosphatase/sedoheptulose 1,7-bisphosphatase-like protein/galactokinase/mevalonate kinase-like predicted kinase
VRVSGPVPPRALLPVLRALRVRGIQLPTYAAALRRSQLASAARSEAEAVVRDPSLPVGDRGRAALLGLCLQHADPAVLDEGALERARVALGALRDTSPYYSPSHLPPRQAVRPARVEVACPSRLDIAMGGLSDVPPWTNERRGRTLSLCVRIDGEPPALVTAEVVADPGVVIGLDGDSQAQALLHWDDLAHGDASTAVARTCLHHLLSPLRAGHDLSALLAELLGGGLHLRFRSRAPKGLGSSSILAAGIVQALLRLLGCRPEWDDVVHRAVAVERLMGVGGGWEDALPGFFGGAVMAESTPGPLPTMQARRLSLSRYALDGLQERLCIFDRERQGGTAETLLRATVRYLSGDPETLAGCDRLLSIGEQAAAALEAGDVGALGPLFRAQWDAWRVVTGGACTDSSVESIMAGAGRWVEGAKVNGAGPGGSIAFIVKPGQAARLHEYLSALGGSIVSWQPDTTGYALREWYEPARVCAQLSKSLPRLIAERAAYERHGEVVECSVREPVNQQPGTDLVGPIDPKVFDLVGGLPLSVLATAASVSGMVGTANERNLRSTKKLIDSTAASVFADEMRQWLLDIPVGTSESKDEYGDAQPGVGISAHEARGRGEIRAAVDVVDGTTPSALGLPGAYSICAVGDGLRSFPDMQAYAILAPRSAFGKLDLMSPPEQALGTNVTAIARALGKRVGQLTLVTHSEDTGRHHTALIAAMRALGVSVIVPEPVIVEPPYALAACVAGVPDIDGMIGVFGLPEIAINTVLCGALNRGKGIAFRLASGSPLRDRQATSLAGSFEFTSEEVAAATSSGLDLAKVYTFESITSGLGCMFAGAAITDDPVLGLPGARSIGQQINVEGWLVDPCGNVYRMPLTFRRPSLIDHSARYPGELFDVSLLADLAAVAGGEEAVRRLLDLAAQIRLGAPGVHVQAPRDEARGEPGLHITLYEFTTDFAPSLPLDDRKRLFDDAVAAAATACAALQNPLQLSFGRAIRVASAVIVEAIVDDRSQAALARAGDGVADQASMNMLRAPAHHHVTLARFTEVLGEEALRDLDAVIEEFNETPMPSLSVDRLSVQWAERTPFRAIRRAATVRIR